MTYLFTGRCYLSKHVSRHGAYQPTSIQWFVVLYFVWMILSFWTDVYMIWCLPYGCTLSPWSFNGQTHDRLSGRDVSLSLYSLSGNTFRGKISWRREDRRFGFRPFRSFWNLTGTWAADEISVTYQSDTVIITHQPPDPNLSTASRLHDIWQ